MNRRNRLTSSTDFKRVRRTGKSYAHPLAILIASPNGMTNSRFGVKASRSVGNAVTRNKAKRLIRAGLDRYIPHILPGWDIILIARPSLAHAEWSKVCDSLVLLLRRAKLMVRNDGNAI
ncbi:MAG: ribonuclease P protein component [Chloroflexi bacterium]|nr:ribonuclease P protein component [Chloroflexota bacterium]